MAALHLHDCRIDLERRLVLRPSGNRTLSPQECAVLVYLDGRAGGVVSADELLREVWGYASGVKTRTVVTTIGRLRKKIEADSRTPRHLHNVYGKGYRFERLDQTPVSADASGAEGLPAAAPGFVGRSGPLEDLRASLSTHPLATLVGFGGMGKTRLALQYAHTHGPAYAEGGAWFVDLTTARTPDDIVLTLARVLGCPDDDAGVTADLARRGATLLVLDNCEQIRGPVADAVSRWGVAAPRARFLATSRVALGVPGEVVHALDALDPEAALVLFLDRARSHRPGYAATPADLHAVVRLLEALEHIPLAVELAAARAPLLGPLDLLERVERQLSVYRDGDRDPRHRTLRAAIAWSWDLLQAPARAALVQCAVFEGTFDPDAAEAVIRVDGVDALEVLETLRRASMVQVVPMAVVARFRLLVSVRMFAAGELGDDAEPLQRHAEYYARFGSMILDREPGPRVAHALLHDRGNMVAAISFAEGQPVLRAKLLLAWGSWMVRRGRRAAVRPLLEAVPLDRLPVDWRARYALLLGRHAGLRGDLDTAWRLLQQAAAGPVPRVAALAQLALSSPDLPHGRDGAMAMIRLAQGYGEAHDDPYIASAATQRTAELAMEDGRWAEAEAMLRRSLQQRGSHTPPGQVLQAQLSHCYRRMGRDALALRHLHAAIEGIDAEEHPLHLANILVHGASGAPADEAIPLLRRAVDLLDATRDTARAADVRAELATHLSASDPVGAEDLWRAALAFHDAAETGRSRGLRVALCTHLVHQRAFEAARAVMADLPEPPGPLVGLLHLAQGRPREALDHLTTGAPSAAWRVCALAQMGQPDEAETLLEALRGPPALLSVVRGFVALARAREGDPSGRALRDARSALVGPLPGDPAARLARALLGDALRRGGA